MLQPYHSRLDFCTALQGVWANIHAPKGTSYSDAPIKLVDHQGNKVGGADDIWGVWVDKAKE